MTYKDLFRKFKVNEGEQATYENLFINLSALPLWGGYFIAIKKGCRRQHPRNKYLLSNKKFGNITNYSTIPETLKERYGIILM